MEDPTGGGGVPRGLVPRPRRWLGDLAQPSVPLPHGPRAAGRRWRAAKGPPGGGRGGHMEDLTGGGGVPYGLVPRPRRWLGDLAQPSVPLPHGPRGAGGRWLSAEGPSFPSLALAALTVSATAATTTTTDGGGGGGSRRRRRRRRRKLAAWTGTLWRQLPLWRRLPAAARSHPPCRSRQRRPR